MKDFDRKTRLLASRSSSIGPEGRFLFFHPKVKVKERISLRSTSSLKKTFFDIGLGRKDGVKWADGVGWMKDG